MDGQLAGCVGIVTGASRGLGRAFAIDLARSGAALTLVARSAGDLEETAVAVRACGVDCLTVVGDVCDDALANHTISLTVDHLGAPSLLVNNAGKAHLGALADIQIDDWWNVLVVNLRAPVVWTMAVLPVMRQHGRGRIINVSSPASRAPLPYVSSYGAAKPALRQFTACLAPEIVADGIVVLAIGPVALTEMTRSLWETDGLPAAMQQEFKTGFTADPDLLMRLSMDLFHCVATGGADHLTGQYVGLMIAHSALSPVVGDATVHSRPIRRSGAPMPWQDRHVLRAASGVQAAAGMRLVCWAAGVGGVCKNRVAC